MGCIRIQMLGSFESQQFETSATRGGHVCAIKRSIEFLSSKLGPAVVKDANCTKDGVAPPDAPLGLDEQEPSNIE